MERLSTEQHFVPVRVCIMCMLYLLKRNELLKSGEKVINMQQNINSIFINTNIKI